MACPDEQAGVSPVPELNPYFDDELVDTAANRLPELELDHEFLDSELDDPLQMEIDRGSRGYLRWLQQSLNRIVAAGLVVDGIMGPRTRAALRQFQRQAGIAVDGIPGPQTEQALLDAGAEAPPGAAPSPLPPPPPADYTPTAVESPGGGRIKDKTPPAASDLVTVRGVGGKSVRLHRLAARAWQALVAAARQEGIRDPLLLPTSGFRDPAHQARLWADALKKYGSKEEARKWVAPPGGSAHQSGRAIDFYLGGSNRSSNVGNLKTKPAYKWLLANARRFGFYPYAREPWHWEYNPPAGQERESDPLQQVPSANFWLRTMIGAALRAGAEPLAVRLAMAKQRDVNKLTDMVFFARHPEMQGRRIERHERQLAREWRTIRDRIVQPVLAAGTAGASRADDAETSGDDRQFRRYKKGYSRYGGGRVDQRLRELRDQGRLSISDGEIDLLQRIANVESRGQIQAINSWDDSYMSMGFMQWPIAFGKLQRLIRHAPSAFRRHGIALDPPRQYHMRRRYGVERHVAIQGAPRPDDLRSLTWAKRFYAAGLDPEIIVAEVKLALKVIDDNKRKIVKAAGSQFLPHYERSSMLRALIQETFNHRPRWLEAAVRNANRRAQLRGTVSTSEFLELVRQSIREVYRAKGKPGSAENLIRKTARSAL